MFHLVFTLISFFNPSYALLSSFYLAGTKIFINFAALSGGYQSGQMGQTVNLLAYAFGGSNPSPPTQQQ